MQLSKIAWLGVCKQKVGLDLKCVEIKDGSSDLSVETEVTGAEKCERKNLYHSSLENQFHARQSYYHT